MYQIAGEKTALALKQLNYNLQQDAHLEAEKRSSRAFEEKMNIQRKSAEIATRR